ncbi:hypothetical protein CEXT_753931 [Caerostris extrusa]|uniref:Uncharacterized protein n=1 Tax=Caerostris extrusa TaxID=172846 RepID=A0AAV4MK14_CAEEX|nr:hypothetical protein CEXT_753931 [Caerostris extrusa]
MTGFYQISTVLGSVGMGVFHDGLYKLLVSPRECKEHCNRILINLLNVTFMYSDINIWLAAAVVAGICLWLMTAHVCFMVVSEIWLWPHSRVPCSDWD